MTWRRRLALWIDPTLRVPEPMILAIPEKTRQVEFAELPWYVVPRDLRHTDIGRIRLVEMGVITLEQATFDRSGAAPHSESFADPRMQQALVSNWEQKCLIIDPRSGVC
jgi:hypothetical protein